MKRLALLIAAGIVLGATGSAPAKVAKPHTVRYEGTIAGVDTTANSVELTLWSNGTVNFTVDTKTKIVVGHTTTTLANLRNGMEVSVRIIQSTGVAEEIEAPKFVEYEGLVESIDTKNDAVVLTLWDESTVDFTVDADTEIVIAHKKSTLNGLQKGMEVSVKILQITGIADEIEAPKFVEYEGTVKSVDTTTFAVALTLWNNSIVDFIADASTKIEIANKTSTLASLREGMEVSVKILQTTGIAERLEAPKFAEHEGTIAAVDATDNTVVMTLCNNSTVKVKADTSTKIVIGHKTSTLASLQIGMRISVKIVQLTGIAERIEAHVTH
jgi:hypothetical protein